MTAGSQPSPHSIDKRYVSLLSSDLSGCIFPPAFRCLFWCCLLKLPIIWWGRYLINFHSRPMLCSQPSPQSIDKRYVSLLSSDLSGCIFPPAFRCLFWCWLLKLPIIRLGRDLINFHSRPMLCSEYSECSQYLVRCLNMGVDDFCWWLAFLWLMLCIIVLVTVGWQFSHEICHCLMIVYFWYSVFSYTVYFGTVYTVYFGTVYRLWPLFLVSCHCWSD